MVRMSLDCDISIWLKYDITTWGLHPQTGVIRCYVKRRRDAGRCEAFDVRKSPHPDFAYLARTGSPATRCWSALSGPAAKSSQPAWFFAL
jgi:hypothetical protein